MNHNANVEEAIERLDMAIETRLRLEGLHDTGVNNTLHDLIDALKEYIRKVAPSECAEWVESAWHDGGTDETGVVFLCSHCNAQGEENMNRCPKCGKIMSKRTRWQRGKRRGRERFHR